MISLIVRENGEDVIVYENNYILKILIGQVKASSLRYDPVKY